MKTSLYLLLALVSFMEACGQDISTRQQTEADSLNMNKTGKVYKDTFLINPDGMTIRTRFFPPPGYKRSENDNNSFAEYLVQLPLKPHNSVVQLYDGNIKYDNGVYDAVVDLAIGKKDLHQCADAIMRLRAEYFWNIKQYDKIHFTLTSGFRADYSEWMQGKRVVFNGNSTKWIQTENALSNDYEDFWHYLEFIFSYAGTYSLSKELIKVGIDSLKVGDIFIEGGFPGHAVIVVDVATNEKNGKKVFLLAQSFMPAQEIQILKNPNDSIISPWYSSDFEEYLYTPEWTFTKADLKRFND